MGERDRCSDWEPTMFLRIFYTLYVVHAPVNADKSLCLHCFNVYLNILHVNIYICIQLGHGIMVSTIINAYQRNIKQ